MARPAATARSVASVLPLLCLGSAALAADVPPAVADAERARIELVEKVAPTVVCIFGRSGGGGGSGVLISPDGFALTNFHVTSGAGDFMKCGLNDGRLYDAVIVGIDPTGDVALIKLLGRDDFPAAALGDSDALEVGQWVYAMGNPFLLASDFTPTVTYGIVSGLHRYQYPAGTFLEYTDCIQFDTSINPGNSGGPLFAQNGDLVGINGRGSFEKRGRVNVGAGYAISINQVKHFLDHLRSGRVVDHGTIGATVSTSPDGTVRVTNVLEDSDAYRRGLRTGDEIVSFADRPIRSANQFQNVLGIYPSGRTLPLMYRRDAETTRIYVQLTNAHRESELMEFSESKPDRENPQPGRDPEGGPPEGGRPEGPGGGPERPRPIPVMRLAEPPVPEELKKLVVKKPGFANYHFNVIEQDRVLASLDRLGSRDRLAAGVALTGVAADGKAFRLTLADRGVALDIENLAFLQPIGEGEAFVDEPAGSGGLLAGLHLLRRVLAGQQDRLAGFHYFGSEPLDGIGPTADVLVAEENGGTARLYVAKDDGRLLGYDFRLIDAALPSRVRFGEPTVSGEGLTLPAEWKVFGGGQELHVLKIERIAALGPRRP